MTCPSTRLRTGGWPSKSAISMAVVIIPENSKCSIKFKLFFEKKLVGNKGHLLVIKGENAQKCGFLGL